jgi:hypothetical protein
VGAAHVQIMKFNGMRMLTNLVKKGVLGPESSIGKLYWSNWHRTLGERAMHVLGPQGGIVQGAPDNGAYTLDEFQRIFMFSRSETIYAGSSEIQRNIIGERVLGLPRETRSGCELRVLRGARPAARRRPQVHGGEVAGVGGPPAHGDDRGL